MIVVEYGEVDNCRKYERRKKEGKSADVEVEESEGGYGLTDYLAVMFFFFQAEDGIRDLTVTGVQTCALPIFGKGHNTFLPFLVGIDGLDWSHGGMIITLYNGDHGWTFDRSGVTELPATAVSDFQEQVKRNVDNLLRLRLKEEGLSIRFGGSDTVDLKSADWVEIADSQERQFRLAVDRSTHLLVRSSVTTKDEETQQINEDVSIYSNYQLKDSVWMPLQVSREHNGRRASQVFYDSCRFNPGFSDELFDKSSLSKQGSQSLAKKSNN